MAENIFKLDGKWNFGKTNGTDIYPVTVPGSVISGLMDNNIIEDPYYRMNEYAVRDMMSEDYFFTRDFDYKITDGKCHELVMDGIDTIAAVYLNGEKVADTDNMHRQFTVNVDKCLVSGSNTIRIEFVSPVRYAAEHEVPEGKEITFINTGTMKDSQYIRKAHSMFGWDWGPQLPDMGIFRSIYIREYEMAVIDHILVEQKHNADQSRVALNVSANIHDTDLNDILLKGGHGNYSLQITVADPDGKIIADHVSAESEIVIDNPKLWWPNRLGEQPLYTVTVQLCSSLHNLSEKTEKIGLRTLTVSQDADEWGHEFCFKVNGVKFFSKGADYIPEDAVYSHITTEKMQHLVDSCAEAGFNSVRMWGGGYYSSDEFYDMCDRAGLVIWQDFMFACNVYELWDDFKVNITKEAVYNVRRIRNHACIGLLCGNNELESAWLNWGDYKGHSDALKKDYLEIFEDILPKVVKEEAPFIFYWPSSPSSGGNFENPDDDNTGDRHYWDVWHGEKPFTDYENYFFRYCSEFGFQSFPEMATIRKFAVDGDFNIFSPVMESHQKNGTANSKILKYISENFLYPCNFESLTYVSQVLQGLAMKYGIEHFRRNRGRCMGALYWQLNDNWPVASWASIDYYGRWKALHYMARDFFADLQCTLKREGNTFIPYVSNETFEKAVSHVTLNVKDMNNNVVFSVTDKIETDAFSVSKGNAVDITSAITGRENAVYFEAVFENSDGTTIKQVEPVLRYKAMNLPNAKVDITYKVNGDGTVTANLKADKFAAFVDIICDSVNIIWDKNFFFITDGDVVTINGKIVGTPEGPIELKVISLSDSYER